MEKGHRASLLAPADLKNTIVEGGLFCCKLTKMVVFFFTDELSRHGAELRDIIRVVMFVSDLADFGNINAAYVTHFGVNPPSRYELTVGCLSMLARNLTGKTATQAA